MNTAREVSVVHSPAFERDVLHSSSKPDPLTLATPNDSAWHSSDRPGLPHGRRVHCGIALDPDVFGIGLLAQRLDCAGGAFDECVFLTADLGRYSC